MKLSSLKGLPRYTIEPGEYHIVKGQGIITTLLGSCVSACLWDPVNQVMGMNHFLLANRRYAHNMPVIKSEAGRYGIHSMELLINAMLKAGAARPLLRAKAFGGGNVLHSQFKQDSFYAVGDVNSRFIIEFLRNENIPLESSDLGGEHGRVINFVSTDYSVYMRRIEKAASEQSLMRDEHSYFDQQLQNQKVQETTKSNDILIWD